MTTMKEVTVISAPPRTSLAELRRIFRDPLERVGAERAIVFGSYARGTADGYSDVDLVVVLDTDLAPLERWRPLAELLDAVPAPVNLFVYTPEELAEGERRGIGVFDALAREGVEVYARSEG